MMVWMHRYTRKVIKGEWPCPECEWRAIRIYRAIYHALFVFEVLVRFVL